MYFVTKISGDLQKGYPVLEKETKNVPIWLVYTFKILTSVLVPFVVIAVFDMLEFELSSKFLLWYLLAMDLKHMLFEHSRKAL